MNDTLRNVLAVVCGVVLGMFINGGIVQMSGMIIPYPEGYDFSSMDKMKETFHLLETKHFIMPWIAHAVGTLVGAIVATKIAVTNHKMLASILAFIFFIFGAIMVFSIPQTPSWFAAADLIGAYLPMGLLGWKLAGSK